ncbi:MAG TPA: TetR/AcrR family transcriptional regulator [Chloroflexota bacterium]|nr:TetR/AcrR family transcriptional regulator [Chloroflexota bacterium]
MNEPKTRRGQASRGRIVEAAADLMFTRGVRATGLDDVLAAAGVGKGQFYHYFADKDALVHAVIARQSERMLDGQRDMLEHLDSWVAIAAWFERMVQVQEQRACIGGCPLGSLASELADQDEAARADLVASFDRWEGYLAAGLARMRARGELRAEAEPAALAAAAMASIQGGLLLTQTRKDARALRRALDGAFAYLRIFAVGTPPR